MSGMPDNCPRRRAEDKMITATEIASRIAAQLDGTYDDGIERYVRASSKGTIIGLDLDLAAESGTPAGGECFIIAVISAPCPPPVDPADPS